MSSEDIAIIALLDAGSATDLSVALDRIFFEASSVQSFFDDTARVRFRERWLGRYLGADAANAFVAQPHGTNSVVGYVVGALDDPTRTGRFGDIAYYTALADATVDYPAHLHINVDRNWRSAGIGARLIAAFATRAKAAGAPGLHIVTGAGMRNVSFYRANGFHEVKRIEVDGKSLVMLGLKL